ncbi:hypothetical protein O0L34_g10127 [Tuta absoluta]|nr:hypothetical protein O0L34_g10127 [Tuta absoluta]
MGKARVMSLCLLGVCLLGSSFGQDANCDYQQNVQPGQTYYVYSPGYPNNYTPGVTCRWIAYCPSGYNCRLNCNEIRLPFSQGCTQDRLLISNTGDPQLNQAETYCGTGSVSAVSTAQAVSVGLVVPRNSPGGRFICQLTAQAAAPPVDNCRCGYRKTNRIVGGQETGVNEYPMMAGIVTQDTGIIKCGAVIISERYLLTAAHCVNNQAPSNLGVVVGEHNINIGDSPATQGFRVTYRMHPQFNPNTYDYDIALLTTNGNIQFSDRVGPACLPFKFASTSFEGETVTALGWGTLFPGGPDSNVLRKVDLNVITQSQCQSTRPPFLSNRQMCTLTPGKDACQVRISILM